MRFEVKNGSTTLVWEDGAVSGPAGAVSHLVTRAVGLEGHHVGFPTGEATNHNHLANALSAYKLMRDLLGSEAEASGDVPSMDETPKGAVA